MGGVTYPTLEGSRILQDDSYRTSISSYDDEPVYDWDPSVPIIVAFNLLFEGKDSTSYEYKLQYKVTNYVDYYKDIFPDSGDIREPAYSTALSDGDIVTHLEARCSAISGYTRQDGVENVYGTATFTHSPDYYAEFQFALDLSNAERGLRYAFQVVEVTSGTIIGECLATIGIKENQPPNQAVLDTSDGVTFNVRRPELFFTGTDPDGDDVAFNVLIDRNSTFDSANTKGSIIKEAGVSSYTEYDHSLVMSDYPIYSESIEFSTTQSIYSIQFKVEARNNRPPAGEYMYAKIYNETHATAFGTDSVPTGEPLYTADPIDTVIFQSEYTEFIFDLSFVFGAITLDPGQYCFTFEYSGTDDVSLMTAAETYIVSGNPTGNRAIKKISDDSWIISSTDHVLFALYDVGSGPLIDAESITDNGAGFKDGLTTFVSGAQASYTPQFDLSDDTYYWKVRARDPSGTNTYSSFTAVQSFVIFCVSTVNTVAAWEILNGALKDTSWAVLESILQDAEWRMLEQTLKGSSWEISRYITAPTGLTTLDITSNSARFEWE